MLARLLNKKSKSFKVPKDVLHNPARASRYFFPLIS